jgi:hypothetical protein
VIGSSETELTIIVVSIARPLAGSQRRDENYNMDGEEGTETECPERSNVQPAYSQNKARRNRSDWDATSNIWPVTVRAVLGLISMRLL